MYIFLLYLLLPPLAVVFTLNQLLSPIACCFKFGWGQCLYLLLAIDALGWRVNPSGYLCRSHDGKPWTKGFCFSTF